MEVLHDEDGEGRGAGGELITKILDVGSLSKANKLFNAHKIKGSSRLKPTPQ